MITYIYPYIPLSIVFYVLSFYFTRPVLGLNQKPNRDFTHKGWIQIQNKIIQDTHVHIEFYLGTGIHFRPNRLVVRFTQDKAKKLIRKAIFYPGCDYVYLIIVSFRTSQIYKRHSNPYKLSSFRENHPSESPG